MQHKELEQTARRALSAAADPGLFEELEGGEALARFSASFEARLLQNLAHSGAVAAAQRALEGAWRERDPSAEARVRCESWAVVCTSERLLVAAVSAPTESESRALRSLAAELGRTLAARLGQEAESKAEPALLRRALASAHDVCVEDASVPPFVGEVLLRLRHGVPRLGPGGPTLEQVLSQAARDADRVQHADPAGPWARTPAHVRTALAARALGFVARAVLAHGEGAGSGPARVAATLLVHGETVEQSLLGTGRAPAERGKDEVAREVRAEARREERKEEAMSNNNPTNRSTMLQTLETDATDAAWRTAGSQFLKLTREPLVGLLSRHLGPNDEALRGRIAGFLETELGTALLAGMLSAALSALPRTAGPVPERLARELRVRAMADTADTVADVLMGPLRQVIMLYLQDASAVAVAAPEAPAEPPRALEGARSAVGFEGSPVRAGVA